MSIDKFKIRYKLALIVGLLSIPVLVLGGLFTQNSLKDINFTQKEKAGVAYLQGAVGVKAALVSALADPSQSPSARLVGAPDLNALFERYGAEMNTAKAMGELQEALRAIGYPNKPLAHEDASEKAIVKAQALIGKISDGSNLTLDPDLDTYYLGDLIVNKLPDALERLGNIVAHVRDDLKLDVVLDEQKSELAIQAAGFVSAAQAVRTSFENALGATADKNTTGALKAQADAVTRASEVFSAEVKAASASIADPRMRKVYDISRLVKVAAQTETALRSFSSAASQELDRLLGVRISSLSTRYWTMLGIAGLLALVAYLLTIMVIRRVEAPVAASVHALAHLARRDFSVKVEGVEREDEFGTIARGIALFREEGLKSEQTFAENMRTRVALDNCSTNVMIADPEGTIVYLNQALQATLEAAEPEFRKELPAFSAKKLVGEHINSFHKNPSHQQRLLSGLKSTHTAMINVGERIMQLTVNPVVDAAENLLGHVVEWKDMTHEMLVVADYKGQLDAISKAQAVIEFDLDGTIRTANENFCNTMGFRLEEIKGQHHQIFVDPVYRASPDYRAFWDKLGRGEHDAGQYKRLSKDGGEVWIQASYNPILDLNGKPFKIVKYATDITRQKLTATDHEGQMNAIRRALCVIEYTIDGKVLRANENFCTLFGYREEELLGQAHSILMAPSEQETPEYRAYREKLRSGQHDTGIYKRIAKDGRVVWIQGSCNPIFDPNGKPYKIVTMFTDISAQILANQMTQRAVEEVAQVVAATKDNDLTMRIPLGGKTGEIEQLCSGVNGLIDTMSGVIATISEAAGTITTAVGEITSGTDDLSRRTEKQASSLEETSASMEQIASTIRLNAENAQEANKLAVNARTLAGTGGDIVTHAVEAMSRIEESSTKVSDIIGVIDEIAFQTNLLALNAAVEAARAGDAGRGFAVVASEVRSLAQRSSEAAKDIKALIVQSGAQVKDGVKLVNDAGSSLSEIVSSVRRVTDIIAEIASASKEQAVGVEEINKAVSQMDEMTQQNSALVEENAAACRLLQDQAEEMAGRMAAFRLDTEIVTLSARPAARRLQPAPVRSAPQRRGGGAAALQADLAHAFADEEWKEF